MFIEPSTTKTLRRSEERINLDGICELEFRSSERRRWVSWARGYKHFTPPGWRAVPSELAR